MRQLQTLRVPKDVCPTLQQWATSPATIEPLLRLRVTAGFLYNRDGKYPHTARRIFEALPTSGTATEV
jgi:hypothetical protein